MKLTEDNKIEFLNSIDKDKDNSGNVVIYTNRSSLSEAQKLWIMEMVPGYDLEYSKDNDGNIFVNANLSGLN
jgi:hypothetical protein